jgi:hypothetical protein
MRALGPVRGAVEYAFRMPVHHGVKDMRRPPVDDEAGKPAQQ